MAGGSWVDGDGAGRPAGLHSKSASATLVSMIRIWRVALLTLLMTLLPLRGWAWSVMPVEAMAHPAAAAHAESAHEPPCHAQAPMAAEAASPSSASSDAADAGTQGGHPASGCAHCDLCHAAVICMPGWSWLHAAPPVAPPGWAVSAAHGLDGQGGPFRPPRA